MKGGFITFEGCEGCGKSTQVRLLKEYLVEKNVPFVLAREPGGTVISEKIREIILDKNNSTMTSHAEALLYAAARCQIIDEVVLPAIKQGKLVILDRYIDSSFAYQSYARGLGFEFVAKANDYALKTCMPDLTIFLNVDPERAFLRKGGVDGQDRLETAGMEFHKKVYAGYLDLCKKFPERIVPFTADGTKFDTNAKIIEFLRSKGFII